MGRYLKVVPGRGINTSQAFDEVYLVNDDGTPWTPDQPENIADLIDAEGPVKEALSATYASLAEQAPNWDVKTRYEVGQMFVKAGRIRQVTTAHTSAATRAGYTDANSVDIGPVVIKPRSLVLRGRADGGDAYDTTSHLIIESYQRPQGGSFGESLRLHNMLPKSKSMISWWGGLNPSLPVNEDTNPLWPMAWIGAHYGAQDDGDPIHGHISIEVPDETLALRTRWGINYVDRDTLMPGVKKATVYSNSADVLVNTSGDQSLILAAYPGDPDGSKNSDRTFKVASVLASEDTIQGVPATSWRWSVGGTAVPETGSNNGTDFMFQPLSDTGANLPMALFIRRRTGRAIFGTSTTQPARISAVWDGTADTTVHGYYAAPTALTAGYAAYAALMPAAGDSFVRQRVVGDTVDRLSIDAAGKHEWGTGAAARDTNLYRKAADILATDDDFEVSTVGKGLILKDANNVRYRIVPNVGGTALTITAV